MELALNWKYLLSLFYFVFWKCYNKSTLGPFQTGDFHKQYCNKNIKQYWWSNIFLVKVLFLLFKISWSKHELRFSINMMKKKILFYGNIALSFYCNIACENCLSDKGLKEVFIFRTNKIRNVVRTVASFYRWFIEIFTSSVNVIHRALPVIKLKNVKKFSNIYIFQED